MMGKDSLLTVEGSYTKFFGGLPIPDVGVVAAAAGLAILAIGHQVEIVVVGAGRQINVGMTPGVVRNVLFQVGAGPIGFVGGCRIESGQALLRGRQAVHVEPELL